MSAALRLAAAGTMAALAAGPSLAAINSFAGSLDLRAGYGSNPYLDSSRRGGSGQLGGTLSGGITSQAALSTTTLNGVADLTQNGSKYGRSTNFTASLSRFQKVSERVSLTGNVAYSNTLNPGISYLNSFGAGAVYPLIGTSSIAAATGTTTTSASDPALVTTSPIATAPVVTSPIAAVPVGVFDASSLDLFTLGQRTQRISGGGSLTWTPTARDQFSFGASASRAIYSSFGGDYAQYGGSVTYLRTVTPRTRVGLDGSASLVHSDNYPQSRSYNADVVLIQRLSAIWSFTGQVGAIIPAGGYARRQSITPSFTASLCGNWTRSNLCLTGARQAAPTGFGGLRTDLQFTGSLSYSLDERTRINGVVTYDYSGAIADVPRQVFYQGSVGLSRSLTRRISVGGSARYQKRSSAGPFVGTSGWSATVDLITRFGHLAG